MKYYKLVKALGRSFYSLTIKRNHFLSHEYREGVFVYADPKLLALGYGLTVFQTMDDVYKYISMGSAVVDRVLFECEIGEVFPHLPPRHNTKEINSMTRLMNLKESNINLDIFPQGTIMTDKVKLIKGTGISI